MNDIKRIPPGAVGPQRTVAPSTTVEAMDLPDDMPPRDDKPLVRKTPNPRPRGGMNETISIDNWEVPPDYMARELGVEQ